MVFPRAMEGRWARHDPASHRSAIASKLFLQHPEDTVKVYVLVQFGESLGQRNFLRANPDAVLRIAALRNPTLLHQGFKSFITVHGAGGMEIEQADLSDGRRSDEG